MRRFKWLHRWLGIVLTVVLSIFSISGVVLNHRELFSSIDIDRELLPEEFAYSNWNLGSVKGGLNLEGGDILLYGNTGVWKSDSFLSSIESFNSGFPKGVDNRKISSLYQTTAGDIYAGTLFGLFHLDREESFWVEIELPVDDDRVVDIEESNGSLIVLTRSSILSSNNGVDFRESILPSPEGYKPETSLFKTLWLLHSGELFGSWGKLFVDLLAIVIILLSISGAIYFINPYIIRRRKKSGLDVKSQVRTLKWNFKWHNRVGAVVALFLLITTVTGMFLRPPLLIPIAGVDVDIVPGSVLDSENSWLDKLRGIIYHKEDNSYSIATTDGIYYIDSYLEGPMVPYRSQPPVSVMGVNLFQELHRESGYSGGSAPILVGSFTGLFIWDRELGYIADYIEGTPYQKGESSGRPIGNNMVSGYCGNIAGSEIYFDYYSGANAISGAALVSMPEQISREHISLWSLALEVHTARVCQSLIGVLYIILIPLVGLATVVMIISGSIVWIKRKLRALKRGK